MTIEREIGGQVHKIELTSMELYKAYREQEHLFDLDDVESYFNCFEDEDIVECFGVFREDVDAALEDIAYEMRRNIDKYDMSPEYARDEVIEECCREMKK